MSVVGAYNDIPSVSEIDFDFWAWGMEKYDRAVEEFDGPDFARLLEDVARED